jgi:hypothetical protein
VQRPDAGVGERVQGGRGAGLLRGGGVAWREALGRGGWGGRWWG